MAPIALYLVIGLFVGLLFLNIYFRVKVFKVYKRLVTHRVEFNSSHVFSKKKMEKEIYPRYPQHIDDIKLFVSQMVFSIQMASLLIFLITIAGLIIKRS